MLRGIDVGYAAVVTLEVEAAWCDHPVERLERRTRCPAARRAGLRTDERARHGALVLRGRAVGTHAGSGERHPGRDFGGARCLCWPRSIRCKPGSPEKGGALPQESSPGPVHGRPPFSTSTIDAPA